MYVLCSVCCCSPLEREDSHVSRRASEQQILGFYQRTHYFGEGNNCSPIPWVCQNWHWLYISVVSINGLLFYWCCKSNTACGVWGFHQSPRALVDEISFRISALVITKGSAQEGYEVRCCQGNGSSPSNLLTKTHSMIIWPTAKLEMLYNWISVKMVIFVMIHRSTPWQT